MFRTKTIFLTIAITLASTSARVITQNSIASALQDILSPTNTDKALQLIQLAAKRTNKMPEFVKILGCNEQFLPAGIKVGREFPIYGNDLPVRLINANEMPTRSYDLPTRAVCANELPTCTICGNDARAIYGKDLPVGTICGNKLPARTINANELPTQRKLTREMPARINSCPCPESDLIQAKNLIQQSLIESLQFPKGMFEPFPPGQEVIKEIGGYPSVINPFLPAASPISATTSCFPPPTQSRGRFLRKIPIPPPTL